MHTIRSPVGGIVHALPKRKGEGVRELETVVVLRIEPKGGAGKPGGAGRERVDVPAEVDGKLLCLGAEVKPGEDVPEGEVVTVELGGLAIKVGKDEKVPEGERLIFPGTEQVYRRWKEGDPFRPDALRVFKETRRFRRSFRRGDEVKEGQILGVVNPALAQATLAKEVARLDAAEADRRASVKTMGEAKTRYESMQASKAKFPGSISAEEFRLARLIWERYMEAARAKKAAVREAEFAVAKALHLLKMHEIRSPLTGRVRAIHKHRGEAVKALGPVLRLGIRGGPNLSR
jgi:biotin carboxyl carrier protein